MKQQKTLSIAYNSVFIVMSLILGFLGRLSIIPVFPFLKLDFSDIPIFLSSLISGIPSGLTALFVSLILRTFMFSSSGWIGFIIRSTSAIVILFLGIFNSDKIKKSYKILWITFGILLCLIVKLFINYFLWINFFNISPEIIDKFMVSIIIPYNLLKLMITVFGSFILLNHVVKVIKIAK